ncbi:MAG: HD-GYP domain-containing protein [Bacillota bacterium]
MKIVNLIPDLLTPGMVLYEDLFNSNGAGIFLRRDTVLTESYIERIKDNNIEKVKIKLPEENQADSSVPVIKSVYDKDRIAKFRANYTEKVDEVTHIIKEIGRGGFVDLRQINEISKHIIHDFRTLSDVINYLHLVRPLDDYTYSHSLNVSLIAIIIAKWLNLSKKEVDEIATAGLLHDIGKTKVSQDLLSKPGRLTDQEFELIKKHTILGYDLIEKARDASAQIKLSVLMHHEKIDGTGYPLGVTDTEIPEFAKIIAVADIYDAMTSNRSYREKMCPFEVIKNFEMQTFGKLDTKVLTVFLKNIATSYLGDFVELSNGEIAEVVFINPSRVWQPIVKSGNEYIDLSKPNNKLYIKQIV